MEQLLVHQSVKIMTKIIQTPNVKNQFDQFDWKISSNVNILGIFFMPMLFHEFFDPSRPCRTWETADYSFVTIKSVKNAENGARVSFAFSFYCWVLKTCFFACRNKPESSPKKEKTTQEGEEPKADTQEEQASGSSWWGSYSSILNKAVDSVTNAVDSVNSAAASAVDSANTMAATAVESAKQKVFLCQKYNFETKSQVWNNFSRLKFMG